MHFKMLGMVRTIKKNPGDITCKHCTKANPYNEQLEELRGYYMEALHHTIPAMQL